MREYRLMPVMGRKTWLTLLAVILLLVPVFAGAAQAAEQGSGPSSSEQETPRQAASQTVADRQRVFDYASLFSTADALQLQEKLQQASEEISVDLVVVTQQWALNDTQKGYAKKFLLENGFGIGAGRESVLFLIDMNQRLYTVFEYNDYASGYVLTDDEIDLILDECRSSMKKGKYADAAGTFIVSTVYYQGVDIGRNYAEGSRNLKDHLPAFWMWVISILGGCAAGGIITWILVSQRNHDAKVSAAVYSNEPLKILRRIDKFTHTTKVVHYIESSSGGHGGGGHSSGGSSGGGHGGSSSF